MSTVAMSWSRAGGSALAAAAWLIASAVPASAGGSTWSFDAERYRPGELARGAAGIAWEHNPQLGTPEDGPYVVYLADADRPGAAEGGRIPSDALRVGEVTITEGPVEERPGFRVGPHGATVAFVVPDVPDGRYEVLHCNVPCTTTLADLTYGFIEVDAGPDAAGAVASPVSPSRSDDGGGGPLIPWPMGAAGTILVVAIAAATRMRRPFAASGR